MSGWRNQLVIQTSDPTGQLATSFLTMQDQAPAVPGPLEAVVNSMQQCIDGKIVAAYVSRVKVYSFAFGSGPYDDIHDKAVFSFRAADGMYGRINVATPKAAIFNPGDETVDLANPDVVNFVNAVLGQLGATTGSAWTSVTGGIRKRITVPGESP